MGAALGVALVTDYGDEDEFVGLLKASIVVAAAPVQVPVIDLSHKIPPFDLEHAARLLRRAAAFLKGFVVVGVVDPGVGSKRRAVALEIKTEPKTWLIGPDNGLLAWGAYELGAAVEGWELDRAKVRNVAGLPASLPGGPTFDGRDLFGPAAGLLLKGVSPAEFSQPIDVGSLVRLPDPAPTVEGSFIHARVVWVDRFGNAQLNVAFKDLPDLLEGKSLAVNVSGRMERVYPATAFAEIPENTLGLIVDSYGYYALALREDSAAQRYGLKEGAEVEIRIGL